MAIEFMANMVRAFSLELNNEAVLLDSGCTRHSRFCSFSFRDGSNLIGAAVICSGCFFSVCSRGRSSNMGFTVLSFTSTSNSEIRKWQNF